MQAGHLRRWVSPRGQAASPGAAEGARWAQSPSPTCREALRLRPERRCDPGSRGATRTGSARGPGARPAGRSTGDKRRALRDHGGSRRLQHCGSVDRGLSYRAPCTTLSGGAPKGPNGGLDQHHAQHWTDPLGNARTEGLPASSSRTTEGRSDGQRPYPDCPSHPAHAGRGVGFMHGGPPGRRSLTLRVSLKTGFRFRFFTAVLRLLCLSGRR